MYVTSQSIGAGAAVNDMGGNQLAPVLLADLAGGDFHQLSGSPTVDAGVADAQLDAFDLDLDPRTLGAAPDMGADELTTAPGALTGAASGLTPTGVTLAGAVHPGGEPTTWRFESGFTTAYGSLSPPMVVAAGSQPVAVHATLSGLETGSVYHYRLVAANARGAGQGADATFRTLAGPGAPTCSRTKRGTRGANRLRGGPGYDTVNAADGRSELVDCGRSRDTARVDRSDRVRGCETVTRVASR